jgi:predicted component of type VI protein secretion system
VQRYRVLPALKALHSGKMSRRVPTGLSPRQAETPQTQHARRDECLDTVLDEVRVAIISELLGHSRPPLNFAQQQRAAVRADVSTVEPRNHCALAEAVKLKLGSATLRERMVATLVSA